MNRTSHLSPERVSAYLDRELPLGERRRLDLHLQSCSECRRRLDGLRGTVGRLAALPRSAPPPALAERVRWGVIGERLEPERRRLFGARLASGWGGWVALGSALVLALAVGFAHDFATARSRSLALKPPREVVTVSEQGFLFQPRTTSMAAGRTFVWNEDLWVEEGVAAASPRRTVLASSPAGRHLLARYHDLGYLISGGGRVLLRDRRDTLELWSGG